MWEWEAVRGWLPLVVLALFIAVAMWWGDRHLRGTIVCPYCGGPGRVRLVGDGRLCACCQIRPAMQTEKGPHKICGQCFAYGIYVFRKGVESERNAPPAPADQARREGADDA
jgi:hypothetical protein